MVVIYDMGQAEAEGCRAGGQTEINRKSIAILSHKSKTLKQKEPKTNKEEIVFTHQLERCNTPVSSMSK